MFLYIIVIVIITDTEDHMSRQREAVLAAVRGSRLHPDAETVFRCVRESMPDISLGTVYRNLGRLADEGLIRRVPVPFGADRFDGTLTVHGHIICSRCGAVCDIPDALLPIDVTLFPIVTEFKLLQPSNMKSPIVVTPSSIMTEVKPVHPRNTPSPKEVALLAIVAVEGTDLKSCPSAAPVESMEWDGNITPDNARKLRNIGASIFVAGTSAIFKGDVREYRRNIESFRQSLI